MKNLHLALLALCVTACGLTSRPSVADAPRPALLEFTVAKPSVGIGEPLVVKYKFTNLESRRVNIFMGKDKELWLNMKMSDSSGHLVLSIPDPKPTKGGIYVEGTAIEPDGQDEGYIVVSRKFQPTAPGQYYLSLSTHLIYTWDDVSGEKTVEDQNFSTPITITGRDVNQLHTIAESLRQKVLRSSNVTDSQIAAQELFSMRDPDVLPVWRELTADPSLNPWLALDVSRELARVGSASAADLLVKMQFVAPERWSQTGYSPLDDLESMKRDASPNLEQHINQLLVANGFEVNHVPIGSAN